MSTLNGCKSFEQWALDYGFDPVYGHLIPKEYQPIYFNKSKAMKCLHNLHQKISQKTISRAIQQMGQLEIAFSPAQPNDFAYKKDMYMLHGILGKLISSFIAEKRSLKIPDDQIIIPKNIGVPLYKIAKILDMKLGMTTDYYFNWQIVGFDTSNRLPQNIKLEQFKLRSHFTSCFEGENTFLCGSAVGSFYLLKIIKILYQVNQNIQNDPFSSQEQNIKLMNQAAKIIERIGEQNFKIFNKLNPNYFYYELRPFMSGYKNIKFQNVQDRQSTTGGAGGHDYSFPIFQSMMSLNKQIEYKKKSISHIQNFPNFIREMIQQIQSTSKIRQYFELKPQLAHAYNKVIEAYKKFFILHNQLIKNFIIRINSGSMIGMAGQQLKQVLKKDERVNNQVLKYQ